jgi:diaminohydroxyphosphoribosylaminopyrimidine deaminase/5-amino-6-(5-phosphoribosylamino)uracil reductase
MGAVKQPVRVIAARKLKLPWPSKLTQSIDQGPVWIGCGEAALTTDKARAWQEIGAKLIAVPENGDQLDLSAMVQTLCENGLTRIFCEGGGAFASSLLGANLVDDLVAFTAGKLFGAEGWPSIGALGVSTLAEAPQFDLAEVQKIRGDLMHRWQRISRS